MASHKIDPEIVAHLEWIGFVRPTGLVVSAPALVRAGAILDRRDAEGQRLLRAVRRGADVFDPKEGPVPYLPDFRRFAESVLGWSFSPKGYAGTPECPIPAELEVPLPDYGETLRPDFAVRELEPKDGASSWQLLVRVLESWGGLRPRRPRPRPARGLSSRPHGAAAAQDRRAGGASLQRPRACALSLRRAAKARAGSTSASQTWSRRRAGRSRPRMRLLLGQARLLSLPRAQRLAALLEDSRKFQNEVSEQAGRAGAARALRAPARIPGGARCLEGRTPARAARRAPRRGLPRAAYRHPAARIPALCRGAGHAARGRDIPALLLARRALRALARGRCALPGHDGPALRRLGAAARPLPHDPRRRRCGRDAACPSATACSSIPTASRSSKAARLRGPRQDHERIEPPLVPDGTIYRALEKLLVLDGERISYRALDVEQIGSVYETMMGFRLETATGRSVAIKAQKKQGAPTAVDLEALLAEAARQAREVAPGPRRPEAQRHGQEGGRWRPRRSRTFTRRFCR